MSTNAAAAVHVPSSLVNRLTEELGRRWHAGERPLVEEYLERYPELASQPEAAAELIYEELCLRQEHGVSAAADDVLKRFPRWRPQLQILLECHRLLAGEPVQPQFPELGERLGDFQLLAELGRGAHGRVFLAAQATLADRPVVLKVTPCHGQEYLSLARLQHTHIVPLYSMQDDRSRDLRVLCMPYFGGATLASILAALRGLPPAQRTGQDIVETLKKAQTAAPLPLSVEGPACQFLARASYTRAIGWIGACLADALAYTHERGLVHLDLKPSNVLWAADGQPMLLDLHLARGPIPAGAAPPNWLGGTPVYMAPEHRLALDAVRAGVRVPVGVDGRADIYSLGLLLCEALGGSPPPSRAAADWLRQHNPLVTVGLADVVDKCLANDPEERYAKAADLAGDLRRHLADLPLTGVGNRSFIERWRKWRRRRPFAPLFVGLGLIVVVSAGLVPYYIRHEVNQARTALDNAKAHVQRHEYGAARDACDRGLALLADVPFQHDLAEELRVQMQLVERLRAARKLHEFVDRVRVLFGADGQPVAELRAVETECRLYWDRRDQIAECLGALPGAEEEQVKIDRLDLAILWTDLRVRLADKNRVVAVRREVLEVLAEAEALFGPSCVLDCERHAHATALGIASAPPLSERQPRTAWEHYAVGRALLHGGELEAAAAQFDRAADLEPQALWPNFFKGKCAHRRGFYEDAVLAFTACLVLAPQSDWCACNRGLAYDALGQPDRALRDYDCALERNPLSAPAALNRGILHSRAQRFTRALDDFQRAFQNGADPVLVYFNSALAYLGQNDRIAALASVNEVLKHDPHHEQARHLAAALQSKP